MLLRAVVVIPPVFDFYFTPHRSSGLGAEIVRNGLTARGCPARLFHFPLQSTKPAGQELPAALNHLRPYIMENETGGLSFFSRYRRFGPSIEDCARQVLADEPDLVLISCFAFCYADAAIELAERIRKTDPRPRIVAGGAGVSAHPDYFLHSPAIDFAFVGEAEVSLPSFLDIVLSGSTQFDRVPNLYQQIGGTIIPPAHVKQTTDAEIDFVLKKTRETSRAVYFSTTLSRGCPKACRFCSNFLSHGRTFRTIPVETIREGLSRMDPGRMAGNRQAIINVEDDNLLLDPAYLFSVLEIFRSSFPNAGFLAENGMDYTLLTPDCLNRLMEYGIRQLNISMVTTDRRSLAFEHREAHLPLVEGILETLKRHGIPSITYFICGLAHDTTESVVDDLVYLAQRPTRVGISMFYPVPGIPDFSDKTRFDRAASNLCAGSSAYPWTGSLTTGQMITAFRLSRLVNLLKSRPRSAPDELLVERIMREKRLYTMVKNGRIREPAPVPNLDEDMVALFFRRLPGAATSHRAGPGA
jgi:hypothetical protein